MKRFYELDEAARVALTLATERQRVPLMALWESMEPELTRGWEFRCALAAEWLVSAASVADLGCGDMALARHLRPDQRYIPVDCVRRDERTVVLDLNTADLRPISADCCAILGVLEYIYDLGGFLARIARSFPRAVASFVCRTDRQQVAARRGMGWVNHLDHAELHNAFAAAGLLVDRESAIGPADAEWHGQYLFALRSDDRRHSP